MDIANSTTQIVLAIIGSGIISTFIVIANDWIKYLFDKRSEKNKEIFRVRETIHKEFLKNMDFIYKNDYLPESDLLRKRHNFLKTYRMMFLYSEDDEIKRVNIMLDAITSVDQKDDVLMIQKKDKIATTFLTLRRHIVNDTNLSKEDFKHIT